MIRLLVLMFALMLFVGMAIALFIAFIFMVVLAAAVGIPLYFMSQKWLGAKGISARARTPIERLRAMYVDGKIDLFEFERRVAQLVHTEHI